MGKFIPTPLKYPLIAFYVFCRCLLRGQISSQARVTLSGVLPLPGSKKIVHGGKPKLLHIRGYFGDTWKGFNLAYFASSGLPFAPVIWLKIYKFFGVRTVWNQNGVAYPALYSKSIVEEINSLLSPIHLSDYVVYQTIFTKRCSERFLGVYAGPSSVLINPVDTEKFRPPETALPISPLSIVMLGNHFESEERMRASLEALRILRSEGLDLKLTVLGNCDQEFEESWIRKTGPFLQSEAPAIFQEGHIFLHLKYLDPCPTAVEEALACGLPVVGQKNGGMPELVEESSGILIDIPEDFEKLRYPSPEEVALALKKVYKDLNSYSQGARKQALKFDKKLWLEKHESIFNELISK